MTAADIPASTGCPPVAGVLTMFYYRDMERALAWYESVMGWPHAMTLEHAAVLRINETSRLVLVGHGQGSQRPLPGVEHGLREGHEEGDVVQGIGHLISRGGKGRGRGRAGRVPLARAPGGVRRADHRFSGLRAAGARRNVAPRAPVLPPVALPQLSFFGHLFPLQQDPRRQA